MSAASGVTVRVPASTANLGPGLDALGMALSLHAIAGRGVPPPGARTVDEHHPAAVAHVAAGGDGALWVRAPIPMGRGLGYSGAVRVAGALLAMADADPALVGVPPGPVLDRLVAITGDLEGHHDNVAASTHGGVVVVGGGRVVRIPVGIDPSPVVVVWVPDGVTTATDRSRAALADVVPLGDAVFNVGRAALLVAALAGGDVAALDTATHDRLHQDRRLASVPGSAEALSAGRVAGAWCGWLSGSGPSVAFLCAADLAPDVVASLPASGHAKVLSVAGEGAIVLRDGARDGARDGGRDPASGG